MNFAIQKNGSIFLRKRQGPLAAFPGRGKRDFVLSPNPNWHKKIFLCANPAVRIETILPEAGIIGETEKIADMRCIVKVFRGLISAGS
jgi:hypothetical protein